MGDHKHQYKLDRLQVPAAIWFRCDSPDGCLNRYRVMPKRIFYKALLGLDEGYWLIILANRGWK